MNKQSPFVCLIFIFFGVSFGSSMGRAAVNRHVPAPKVLTGGAAGGEFSIGDIAHEVLSGNRESLSIAYGDGMGRLRSGMPGYFHAEIDRGGRRVVIDLAQVSSTMVDPAAMRRAIARSKWIASSEITMDPLDSSTNITLLMKIPVKVTARTELINKSQIIFHLEPLSQ